jgi:hypothetical protein
MFPPKLYCCLIYRRYNFAPCDGRALWRRRLASTRTFCTSLASPQSARRAARNAFSSPCFDPALAPGLWCFGSASRPPGRFGVREADPPPSPKAFPCRPADASALRSCCGLRFRYRGSRSGVIDIPARLKHSPQAFPFTLDYHVPLAAAARVSDALFRSPRNRPPLRPPRSFCLSDSMVCQTSVVEEPITKKKAPSKMLGAGRGGGFGTMQQERAGERDDREKSPSQSDGREILPKETQFYGVGPSGRVRRQKVGTPCFDQAQCKAG